MDVSSYFDKYGKGKFDKYLFFDDLYNDFLTIVDRQHAYTYNGYLNVQRAIKTKFDAIANRLLGSYADKIWKDFINDRLTPYVSDKYPAEHKAELEKQRIRAEQEQRQSRFKNAYQRKNSYQKNDFFDDDVWNAVFWEFAKDYARKQGRTDGSSFFNFNFDDFFSKQGAFGNNSNGTSTTVQRSFAILKLPISATLDEVKTAFRILALQLHPDRGGDHDKFIELNTAKDKCIAYLETKH
jgi:hypothetical protein